MANESGVVTDTYSYDAFGNLLKSKGYTKNCYRYCGEQFDETTGLYYLRARYMDTSTGRFISQDSYAGSISDPTSLHKYLYANANPVTYTDPSGYISALAEAAIVGAAIGGILGYVVPNVLAVFKCLDMDCDESYLLSPMDNFKNILQGMIFGALFGIMLASGFACIVVGFALFNGGLSALVGYDEYLSGNYRTAIAYGALSIISFLSIFILLSMKKPSGATTPSNNDVLGNVDGKTPAQQVADTLVDGNNKAMKNPTNPSKRINTVAVFRSKDGQYVIGYNGSKCTITGTMKAMLDFVLPNKYQGKCAEINAINNAIEMGIDVKGGSISTAFVGGIRHGMQHNPCGVCTEILWLLDIILNGGW